MLAAKVVVSICSTQVPEGMQLTKPDRQLGTVQVPETTVPLLDPPAPVARPPPLPSPTAPPSPPGPWAAPSITPPTPPTPPPSSPELAPTPVARPPPLPSPTAPPSPPGPWAAPSITPPTPPTPPPSGRELVELFPPQLMASASQPTLTNTLSVCISSPSWGAVLAHRITTHETCPGFRETLGGAGTM